jgi:hypothetical protein
MVEEIRRAKQARDLLKEIEGGLKDGNPPEVGRYITQLEQLAQSYPAGHTTRLSIESAAESVKENRVGKASSDVSRSRSAIEGQISTLEGALSRKQAQ